jgi:hypothetical protein
MLRKSRGSAPVPTPLNRGNHGGIAPTRFHNWFRRAIVEFLILTVMNVE